MLLAGLLGAAAGLYDFYTVTTGIDGTGGVQLVINTTDGQKSISDSRDIRRTALLRKLPYYTTIPGALAAVEGIIAYREGNLTVRPLQDYFKD